MLRGRPRRTYPESMAAPRLFTFGHSTRTAGETVDLLREFGVERVVDVRSIRGSRHNPQFGVERMSSWLADADIEYRWIEDLGGRRRKQPVDPSVNAGWRHPSFHKYADWMLGDDFAAGLDELIELAGPVGGDVSTMTGMTPPRAALMCAEAVPWRCHRSLIATALVARGWHVTHILGPGQTIEHEIGRWGAVPHIDDDRRITYPGGSDE